MLVPLSGPVVPRQGYYPDGKPYYKEPVGFPGAFVLELKLKNETLSSSLLRYNQTKLDFINKQKQALVEPPAWIDLGYWNNLSVDNTITYYYQLVYPSYSPPGPIWANWPNRPQQWVPVSTKTYRDAIVEQNESIS